MQQKQWNKSRGKKTQKNNHKGKGCLIEAKLLTLKKDLGKKNKIE